MIQIIRQNEFSEIFDIAESVTVFNFQGAMNGVVKRVSAWPFQISKVKRIEFKKAKSGILVKGEPYYYYDYANFQSVFLQKKTPADFSPTEIFQGTAIADEKRKYVEKLLQKHFGENWREDRRMEFFVCVLDGVLVKEKETPMERIRVLFVLFRKCFDEDECFC